MFTQIESIIHVPELHRTYAKALLNHIIHNWNEEEEEVGIRKSSVGLESLVTIEDGFGNVYLSLLYKDFEYRVELTDDSEGNFTSQFYYTIPADSDLAEIIPASLREKLVETFDNME